MVDSLLIRCLIFLGGVQDPHGGMPRDMRLTYSREMLRTIVGTMLAWPPERIIIAHGRWYDNNGFAELRRAIKRVLNRNLE